MRIAISSTQCNGKSTLINSFLNRWSMYETPKVTYRDLIKSHNLTLNQKGSLESQKIIRDSLADQAILNSDVKNCIHDRCILDNLAYTLWLAEKEIIKDDEFIADSINLTRETLKFYDIIFWLPISSKSPVSIVESENRDLDLTFREEINNIFKGIEHSYIEHSGLIFPLNDSPALIPIEGDEAYREKTNLISLYLREDGSFNNTDESVFKTLTELAEEEVLTKNLINQLNEKPKKSRFDI